MAWRRALSAHGFDVPAFRIHRLIGMGGDQLVPALLGDDAERRCGDDLRAAWKEQYEPLLGEVRSLPGAAELVRAAQGVGLRVVFASSSPPEHLERYLDLLDASELRDRATTADDVAATKPAPDLIEAALAKAGTRRAVLVGDATHDVRAAARAGVPCVCVLTGGYGEAELIAAGAERVTETAGDLVERLGELARLAAG